MTLRWIVPFGVGCFFVSAMFLVGFTPPKTQTSKLKISSGRVEKELLSNVRNKFNQIQTFQADFDVISNLPIGLSGTVWHEKQNKHRIQVKSKYGIEFDAGSNELDFWFWSKRAEPRIMYYGSIDNENLMKAEFRPSWTLAAFNFGIPDADVVTAKEGSEEVFLWSMTDAIGSLRIDRLSRKPCRSVLYDKTGRVISQIEFTQWASFAENDFPQRIRISWRETNQTADLLLKNFRINVPVGGDIFMAPAIKPKQLISRPAEFGHDDLSTPFVQQPTVPGLNRLGGLRDVLGRH